LWHGAIIRALPSTPEFSVTLTTYNGGNGAFWNFQALSFPLSHGLVFKDQGYRESGEPLDAMRCRIAKDSPRREQSAATITLVSKTTEYILMDWFLRMSRY